MMPKPVDPLILQELRTRAQRPPQTPSWPTPPVAPAPAQPWAGDRVGAPSAPARAAPAPGPGPTAGGDLSQLYRLLLQQQMGAARAR